MNALKHQPTHPTAANPAIFKDAFGGAKMGESFSRTLCALVNFLTERKRNARKLADRSRERCERHRTEPASAVAAVGRHPVADAVACDRHSVDDRRRCGSDAAAAAETVAAQRLVS